ncbi:phage tail protein [Deinococcus lacus]|uniref:Phage tail protein n=1 Tax=Deinococcus lacus TaxID=392561 RepID=A0ABW1YGS2_9DEIO
MTGPITTYAEYLPYLSRINRTDYQDSGTQGHLAALARPLDELALKARTVMLARLIPHAPEDALLLLGRERGLRRYPGEPLATYRTRVLGAWVYWEKAGTLPGLAEVLAQVGFVGEVVEHWQDPDPEHWAEFSVRLLPTAPLPAFPVASLVDLLNELKPAHARLRYVYIDRGQHGWDEGETWDSSEQWDGSWDILYAMEGI